MSSIPPTKTAAMVQRRRNDSKAKRQAVLVAIEAMERTRTPITVAEVARRAHVSPWLVRQEPLLAEVRYAQKRLSTGVHHGAKDSNTGSIQVERELLRQENQRLRHETRIHRQRISELLGDQIDGTDAEGHRLSIQELTDQNAALSKQASEATQQVRQLQQQLAAVSTDLDAAHAVNRSLMAELNRSRNPVRRPDL